MPEALRKAHAALDKAVDAAYGYKPVLSKAEGSVLSLSKGGTATDEERVAFLFTLYQALV